MVVDEPEDGRDTLGRLGQEVELLEVVAHERALEDKVFRRVAGEDQLGEADDVGALLAGAADPFDHKARVALEITHDRVDLRERDPQRLPHVINFETSLHVENEPLTPEPEPNVCPQTCAFRSSPSRFWRQTSALAPD